jgi:hypothetical protein
MKTGRFDHRSLLDGGAHGNPVRRCRTARRATAESEERCPEGAPGLPRRQVRASEIRPRKARRDGGKLRRMPPPARRRTGPLLRRVPHDRRVFLQEERASWPGPALRGMPPGVVRRRETRPADAFGRLPPRLLQKCHREVGSVSMDERCTEMSRSTTEAKARWEMTGGYEGKSQGGFLRWKNP